MRLNIAAGFLGMVWLSVPLGMPLPLLMQAVQASGFQLGLLSAAWQLAMLAQIPSALLVERLARRKTFWVAVSIPHRCLWAVPALLPIALPDRREWWPAIIIAALALSNVLGQAGTAPWQSWMADLVPPERAGRFWGARHRLLSVSVTLAAMAFGFVLDAFSGPAHPFLGFQIVFGAAAVFGVADIVVHSRVPEPAPVHAISGGSVWQRIAAPLRDRCFRRLTLAMGVWAGAQAMLGYTMGLPGFFSMVYLKESFGASYAQAASVFVASALGAVLWLGPIGRWIDAWGVRRVLLLLTGAGPLCMLAWLFVKDTHLSLPGAAPVPQPVVLMCAASLAIGGLYGGTWICQARFTQALTQPRGRTLAMGVHWSIVGLIGSCGPLLAGWIKDRFGAPASGPFGLPYFSLLAVLHVAIAWGVVVPLIRGVKRCE